MSVKVCPECGAEYVMSVEVCADDGSELMISDVEEMEAEIDEEVAQATDRSKAELVGEETESVPAGEQVAYELADWDAQSRVLLGQLMTGEAIVHVWEAGTLVIRAVDEQRTDELIEQVEVTTQPTLDPDKEQVVYELEEWPEEKRVALAESLADAVVPFGFDENDDLVVHEEDEERVAPILDQVDFNFSIDGDEIAADDSNGEGDGGSDGSGPAEEDDGLAVQDTLSGLFVAADRLQHNARDKEGVVGMADGAEAVAALGLPYGFAPGVWSDIVERSASVASLLESDESDDSDITEAARGLREVLRPIV